LGIVNAIHLKPFKSESRHNGHHSHDVHVGDEGVVQSNSCMD